MTELNSIQPMLEGVRVLDFTQYVAGPTVTRMMAELGAEIIKVEQSPGGDPSRKIPVFKQRRSAYYVQHNRGKQSLCVDFAKPETIEILHELVKTVDIVVENYGPGVMAKRKLDYATLRLIHPKLIFLSISAFGRTGPLSDRVGFDLIAQAFSGLMHMTGEPDGPPQFVNMAIADVNAGVHGFGFLGYALYHRERTGRGQNIDVAMVDALYHMHEANVELCANARVTYEPLRCGAHNQGVAPYGVFKGAQGWIAILAGDLQWPGLPRAMARPELITDPRFVDMRSRAENRLELVALVEAWMGDMQTDEAILDVLAEHRVPCAPVLSVADTITHPHFVEREMVRRVPDKVIEDGVIIPGFPIKSSELPSLPELWTSFRGQDNKAVLQASLGYSDEQIEALCESGVLHAESIER
ncbi:MAG: CoA transferase [Porticoccaceae bacterium]|mgnify:CR=1 FL=1|nr:CoA transferase [Porticoccaceae bacterium]